ncbi:MAG: hypothetical protein WCC10_05635 [Tumebacillaceae bacterium]
MPLTVVHDFLKETENGYILTLYLSRESDVEFASELGRFENPLDDRYIFAYIRRHHPETPINQVRIVTGDGDIEMLSYMSVMAGVRA